MSNFRILWADDEIDLLKPQILFLKEKGYDVITVNNGNEAIDLCENEKFDLLFLDENMPGLSGLQTLDAIKKIRPDLPVVMITKSEEENIMEDAIGSQITNYLIKPVNPRQVLSTVKQVLKREELVQAKTTLDYQQVFRQLLMEMQENRNAKDWIKTYNELIQWELKLASTKSTEMEELIAQQKQEANREFFKFVSANYSSWIAGDQDAPILSHQLMKKKVLPHIESGTSVFFVVLDNLRLDQWKTIQPMVDSLFTLESSDHFFSILPTTTQYSRNAIFSGMMPLEISKRFPDFWKYDEEEGGKNKHEEDLLKEFIIRNHLDIRYSYTKISNHHQAVAFEDKIHNLLNNEFNAVVFNFVDILSHARTESDMIKQLASDESAYRSLARSWFEHSPIYSSLKKLADQKVKIIFTTDHGTIRVKNPSKLIGDRNTTTNLRYKHGKNLNFQEKDCLYFKEPEKVGLPKSHISSSFVFAREDYYFVYPNNYNHFARHFKDTFQHGGISMEEMIVPIAVYKG